MSSWLLAAGLRSGCARASELVLIYSAEKNPILRVFEVAHGDRLLIVDLARRTQHPSSKRDPHCVHMVAATHQAYKGPGIDASTQDAREQWQCRPHAARCATRQHDSSLSLAPQQPLQDTIALLACRYSTTTTYAAGRPSRPASRDHRTMHALRAPPHPSGSGWCAPSIKRHVSHVRWSTPFTLIQDSDTAKLHGTEQSHATILFPPHYKSTVVACSICRVGPQQCLRQAHT